MSEYNTSNTLKRVVVPIESSDVLSQWRERFLTYILRAGVVAGLFALIASMISDLQEKNWVDLAVTSTIYVVVLAITFIRLPYRLRAIVMVILLYALMLNSLLSSGIRGDALPFSVGFGVFSLMLLGVWAGGIALGVSIFSIAVVGWATVAGQYTLKNLYDQLDPSVWVSGNVSMPLVTVLLMLGVVLLQREFQAAQKREKAAMDIVMQDRKELENRVTERTHELSLAAEVGRKVSQMRDLNLLLPDAVEMIRSQFSLYYVQIYLTDVSGRILSLKAGTGGVGAELIRRGHRLSVGPGSINGVAAAERKPVIVADTAASPIYRANPLLPETRSELAVPLTVGERVVGVLDLQSRRPGELSEENLTVFEALAGQLAIALDNAALFAQTEQARTEIEEQTRHLTQAGWEDFLNALERSERIGYLYDQTNLYPFNTQLPAPQAENTVKSQIVVTGTPVGTIQLERGGDQPWQEDEVELVNAVVSQASRQLDNLRLLAQAESYRMEAEASARRLTREGWAEYLQTKSEVNSFIYNHTQVTPLESVPVDSQPGETVVQPLMVGAEKVGELAFDGIHPLDAKTSELVNNVADLLTNHVESLRLTEQTQKALIETEDLYSASAELNTARTYSEILDVLRRHTLVGGKAHVVMIYLFNRPGSENDMPEFVEPAAAWNELELEGIMGRFSLGYFPSALATLHPNYPTLVEDVENDNRLDDAARSLYSGQLKSRSLIIAPLVAGGLWMGYITAGFMQTREFPPEEVRRMMALAAQAAVAINNLRLLDETQALAQREKNLRQITALVRGSTNADTILRTATRELGVVLGRKVKVQLGGNPAPHKPTNGNASKTSES